MGIAPGFWEFMGAVGLLTIATLIMLGLQALGYEPHRCPPPSTSGLRSMGSPEGKPSVRVSPLTGGGL